MSYINTLMIVSAAAGIIELTAAGTRFEKQVKLIISLCICCALLLPIKAWTGTNSFPDVGVENEEGDKYEWDASLLEEMITSNIENSIAEAIRNKFGFKNIESKVETEKNERGEFVIRKAIITFKKRGEWYRSADVKRYIEGLIGAETEVRLDDR